VPPRRPPTTFIWAIGERAREWLSARGQRQCPGYSSCSRSALWRESHASPLVARPKRRLWGLQDGPIVSRFPPASFFLPFTPSAPPKERPNHAFCGACGCLRPSSCEHRIKFSSEGVVRRPGVQPRPGSEDQRREPGEDRGPRFRDRGGLHGGSERACRRQRAGPRAEQLALQREGYLCSRIAPLQWDLPRNPCPLPHPWRGRTPHPLRPRDRLTDPSRALPAGDRGCRRRGELLGQRGRLRALLLLRAPR